MAKPGAYKSEKRKKEQIRQKKQEEKRLRRIKNVVPADQAPIAEGGQTEGTNGVQPS